MTIEELERIKKSVSLAGNVTMSNYMYKSADELNADAAVRSNALEWLKLLLATLEETEQQIDEIKLKSHSKIRTQEVQMQTGVERIETLFNELAEAHAEIERLNTALFEMKELRTVAINQSERHKSEAAAWEDAHDNLHHLNVEQTKALAEAQQTIARLTKALSFYGNRMCIQLEDVGWNVGFIAREALRKVGEGAKES